MYVCCCMGVTDRTIRTAIRNGSCSVEEVTRCSGAGSRCGACKPEIASMIAQHQPREASAVITSSHPSHRHLSMHVETVHIESGHEHAADRSAA